MALSTSSLMADAEVPSYISARAANSLISDNRPTRIQAETLLVLNRLLDELLLLILSSARSLATDRIKTDGMLKVLGNNLLAKDAVLEAELELRSYLDGKRAEGAKVPLGLMATSRLDGTEDFPVTSAYNALRILCQYYSTLGDREDDSAGTDQNIMSSDGRPIATITPGVAIYVTALLEFVGEHVLQNIARVIERDNSDEASLYDLRAALTEDEHLAGLFNKMAIKAEVERRIEISHGGRLRRLNGPGLPEGSSKGGRAEAKTVKPWQVPTENELDEAAAPARLSARRISVQPVVQMSRQNSQHERASSSGHSLLHGGLEPSESVTHSSTNPSLSTAATSASGSGSISPAGTADGRPGVSRRQSSEKGWSGVFGQMKRRNSQRQSTDITSGSFGKTLSPPETALSLNDSAFEPENDFEALVMSGQTMKVSLTPNRLRTIEVAKKEAEARKNARRRPGALISPLRDDFAGASVSATPSSVRRTSVQLPESSGAYEAADGQSRLSRRPSSRGSLQAPSSWSAHPDRKFGSQPPSSYRSPSSALVSSGQVSSGPTGLGLANDDEAELTAHVARTARKMQPRDGHVDRGTASQEMVDFLRSAPSQDTASSHDSLRLSESGSDGSRKVGVGLRVRSLFGRKASINGKDVLASPTRTSVSSMRDDTQSMSGHVSPSGESSAASHGEHRRSPTLPAGSIGRRAGLVQQDAAILGDAGPRGPTPQDARPRSPAGANARSPRQALFNGAVTDAPPAAPATASPAASIGAVGGDRFRETPTRAAATRPDSQGTTDDRRGANGRNGRASPGPTGLYADVKQRPRTPPSPQARQRQEEPPSRKVPWGYKRHSTSSYNRTDADSTGTPTSDKRRSVGYQSSNGHGATSYRTTHGSAENDDTPSSTQIDEGSPAHGGRTLTLFHTTNGRRGSGAQSSLAASRDSSSFGTHQRPSASAATLLAELERQMRDYRSVEECRALVSKALSGSVGAGIGSVSHGGGGGESDVHDGIVDIPDEASSVHGAHLATTAAAGPAYVARSHSNGIDSSVQTALGATSTSAPASAFTSAFAVSPTVARSRAPTSLETCDHNQVVAWLLGGEEEPSFHAPAVVATDGASGGGDKGKTDAALAHAAPGAGKQQPTGPYIGGAKAKMGSVVSLASNYRDASEGGDGDDEI